MATIDVIAAALPPYYGTALRNGSSGPDVAQLQTWLNGVRSRWPQLPSLTVDGRYGSATARAVAEFQTLTGLSVDGVAGANTWNMAYNQYAALHGAGEIYPGMVTRQGTRGAVVKSLQQKLNLLRQLYPAIQSISNDGIFGSGTAEALRRFQAQFGLSADAAMGPATYEKLRDVIVGIGSRQPVHVDPRYPGYVLQRGSSGDPVRFVQSYLSALGGSIPKLTIDGKFGAATQNAVSVFQAQHGLKVDGKVGPATWSALVDAFNATL